MMKLDRVLLSFAAIGLGFGLVAQDATEGETDVVAPIIFEALPGVVWEDVGEGWYRSPLFGDFMPTENSTKRFFTKALGWLTVVEIEAETNKLILRTDDHGLVYTYINEWCDPGIGRNVHSMLNDTTYMVVFEADKWPNKFFNRKTEVWQEAIMHPLWDYQSYFQDTYNYTVATQTIVGQMQELLVQHMAVTTATDSEAMLAQMESLFDAVDFHYDAFVFFYWRTTNAWFFARDDEEREAATDQVPAAEGLLAAEVDAYVLAQEVLAKSKAHHESVKSSGGGAAGADWYNPIIVGPVAQDVMSWPQNITLLDVQTNVPSPNAGYSRVTFQSTKTTPWKTVNMNSGGDRPSYADGNWWVIQKIGDKFYGTTMDYFRPGQFYTDWAPAVFWEHMSNGLKFGKKQTDEAAPMFYQRGETYGLMVTTLARRTWRTTNERSNIVLFKMP